jgi:hypothetical protein
VLGTHAGPNSPTRIVGAHMKQYVGNDVCIAIYPTCVSCNSGASGTPYFDTCIGLTIVNISKGTSIGNIKAPGTTQSVLKPVDPEAEPHDYNHHTGEFTIDQYFLANQTTQSEMHFNTDMDGLYFEIIRQMAERWAEPNQGANDKDHKIQPCHIVGGRLPP